MIQRLAIALIILVIVVFGCSKANVPADSNATPAAKSRALAYDDSLDGSVQIAGAVRVAAKDGKNVLLQFGGNWCEPCLKLHNLFETNKEVTDVLQANYVYVAISCTDQNKHLLEKYRAVNLGVPKIVILDSNGKYVTTAGFEGLDKVGGYNPAEVVAFLNEWTPKACAAKQAVVAARSPAQWVQLLVNKPLNDDDDIDAEIEQLRKHPDESVAALMEVLRSRTRTDGATDDQCIQAYSALGALRQDAKTAIPFLADQFTTENHLVHFTADTLPKLGPEAKAVIPSLTAILNRRELVEVLHEPVERSDSRSWLLYSTAVCLSHLDSTNPVLRETMLAWLKSPNVFCKRVAPDVLGNIGPAAKSALPELTKALSDKDKTVQQNAAEAISKIKADSVPAANSK